MRINITIPENLWRACKAHQSNFSALVRQALERELKGPEEDLRAIVRAEINEKLKEDK